jgi:hypothetical protein
MYIEVELDDLHSERLALLQQRLQKTMPEVLMVLIDWAMDHPPGPVNLLPEPMSIGQWDEINLLRDGLYDNDGR